MSDSLSRWKRDWLLIPFQYRLAKFINAWTKLSKLTILNITIPCGLEKVIL